MSRFASHPFLPIRPYFIPPTLSDNGARKRRCRFTAATSRISVFPLIGAIVRYWGKLRWAPAIGFPVALLEALSLHRHHHSIYATRSPHRLLFLLLLQQLRARRMFSTRYDDPLSYEVEGHQSDLRSQRRSIITMEKTFD